MNARVIGAGCVDRNWRMGVADVFLSHVEQDAPMAEGLAAGLEECGYSTWLYERDSLPGLSYLRQTGDAIVDCSAFLVLISLASMGSIQVDRELIRAFEEEKPIFPLRFGVSHAEFQQRKPGWRQAIGSCTSIAVQPSRLEDAASRTAAGLRRLEILPAGPKNQLAEQETATPSDLASYQVFVSAREAHERIVERICSSLRRDGVTVFSMVGEQPPQALQRVDEALDSAQCFVGVGSPDDFRLSLARYEWESFQQEILLGRKTGAKMIGVLVSGEPADLPRAFRVQHSVKWEDGSEKASLEAIRVHVLGSLGLEQQ